MHPEEEKDDIRETPAEEGAKAAEPEENGAAEDSAPDEGESRGASAEAGAGSGGSDAVPDGEGQGAEGDSAPEGGEASAGGEEAGPEAEAEPVDPALAAALEEAARWKDRAARIQADFDNYRKRQAREREETIKQANADLLEELLPVLDQTDDAIAAVSKDVSEAAKPFLDGFELVRRTFLNAVAKFGLKPVESQVGKPLDPETSEALSVMKTGQAEPGCVAFETRKGYVLGGKLLRAAQVVVEQED